jgi:hypothetical protein
MLRVSINELRWLNERFDTLESSHLSFLQNDFGDLVVAALCKAERLRTKERVTQIGLILANAAEAGPSTPLDLTDNARRLTLGLSF